MPAQPALPPLLLAYLLTPQSSLSLLTSTLGASTNWLVLRFIHAALNSNKGSSAGSYEEGSVAKDGESRVVLISWLRDAAWWMDGGRKLGTDQQKIKFVDALSVGLGLGGREGLVEVEKTIAQAITESDGGKVLLVLDGLDFYLAATACPVLDILELIGELRQHVHGTIVTSAADSSLTQLRSTPLEVSHATIVLGMGHQAHQIMSVRELDTGAARDVSGVLRITRGAGGWDDEYQVEEKECLYFVGGDGGVSVFERGA